MFCPFLSKTVKKLETDDRLYDYWTGDYEIAEIECKPNCALRAGDECSLKPKEGK